MKIKYKKKRLKYNLIWGIIWLILGLLNLNTEDKIRWTDYGYIIIGILYLGQFFYEYYKHYLTIENGMIFKNTPFSKKINLTEITWIKKVFDEYILITDNTKIKLKIELIDEKSLTDLNNVLGKLSLSEDKTPFANNG